MNIPRAITGSVQQKLLTDTKIVLLYGPRQVGKTTLVKDLLATSGKRFLYINADEHPYLETLGSRNLAAMQSLVVGYDVVCVDEAQRILDIGINLKILADGLPRLRIIATGSSSFELANRVAEPLTGRTWTYMLYPLSFLELSKIHTPFELHQLLPSFLVFGGYPDVYTRTNSEEKKALLLEIIRSYLYKDVLEMESIRHANKIHDLLRLLAFQVGSEVSTQELSRSLEISRSAVDRYIDLLEKSFVLFRVPGFSRNLRKEVRKMDKIYFYDVGIRNAVIGAFQPLELRDDQGKLWENFLMSERMKKCAYEGRFITQYFWRLHTGAELDYVEEENGVLKGYEFKFRKSTAKAPLSWQTVYPQASFSVVHKENYLDFVV